ncbi:MAG: endonuclease/exonuclease/phosphatase family protein [Deltaproteobacteria bacterium]|nr:endonuclease/exonuclease/phosphatase family protein [Deltaproteobacteria bacterium]
MGSLRAITYNIRKGKGASGRASMAVDGVARALEQERVDLLLCQEVFHGSRRGPAQSQELAAILGLSHYYRANKERRAGHHGNAVFTKYPVQAVHNHDVSTNFIERRGVLYLKLDVDGTALHVLNVHLGLSQRQRLTQIARIAAIVREAVAVREPVILGGDFNDWNEKLDGIIVHELGFANAAANLRREHRFTWHARRPMFNLDRIYLRNMRARHAECLHGHPWRDLSDHLPLAVDLEIE